MSCILASSVLSQRRPAGSRPDTSSFQFVLGFAGFGFGCLEQSSPPSSPPFVFLSAIFVWRSREDRSGGEGKTGVEALVEGKTETSSSLRDPEARSGLCLGSWCAAKPVPLVWQGIGSLGTCEGDTNSRLLSRLALKLVGQAGLVN